MSALRRFIDVTLANFEGLYHIQTNQNQQFPYQSHSPITI